MQRYNGIEQDDEQIAELKDEIAALKAELAQNKQWVSDLEIECARSPTHKDMAELKAEIEQLKFGREALLCPRTDK